MSYIVVCCAWCGHRCSWPMAFPDRDLAKCYACTAVERDNRQAGREAALGAFLVGAILAAALASFVVWCFR